MVEFIRPTFLPLLRREETLEPSPLPPLSTPAPAPSPEPPLSSVPGVPDLISQPPLLQTLAPTPTEITLQQSLLPEFRFRTPEDLRQALIVVRQLEPQRLQALAEPAIEAVEEPIPFTGRLEEFVPEGVKETFIDIFTGRRIIRAQAESIVRGRGKEFIFGEGLVGEPTFKPGTEKFEREVEKEVRKLEIGSTLQSAIFLSLAGIRVPIGRAPARIPLRPVREPTFVEFQQPVVLPSGRQITIGKFEITTELRPPTIVEEPGRGLLFGRIEAPKIERVISLPTIEGLPVTTVTTRGARVGRLDVLTGISRRVTPEEIRGLPRTQEFLFERFAEAQVGRPVPKEFVPRVLGRGREFELGELTSLKLGKIDIGKAPTRVDLFPPRQLGRRITRFETLAEFKEIAKTPELEVLGGQLLFKEVTKPFARARGVTPRLRGIVFRAREPIILEGDLGVQVLRPVSGKKTPLSKTFEQQILKPLEVLPKPLPKARRPRAVVRRAEPTRVGVVGILPTVLAPRVAARVDLGIVGAPPPGFFEDLGLPISPIQRIGERERIGILGLERQVPAIRDIGLLGFDIKTAQREISGLRFDEKLVEKLVLGEVQKLTQRQKLASRSLTLFEFRKPSRRLTARRFVKREEPIISPFAFKIPRLSFFEEETGIGERKKGRVPIRPSFTGIVLGIKEAAIITETIGVSPISIRGLETGFEVPKRKKTKKKVSKKKKKKS